VLCSLIGEDRGEEYGKTKLARLPVPLLDDYVSRLADGYFTPRTLDEVRTLIAEHEDPKGPQGG
jgi:hypothetical protein